MKIFTNSFIVLIKNVTYSKLIWDFSKILFTGYYCIITSFHKYRCFRIEREKTKYFIFKLHFSKFVFILKIFESTLFQSFNVVQSVQSILYIWISFANLIVLSATWLVKKCLYDTSYLSLIILTARLETPCRPLAEFQSPCPTAKPSYRRFFRDVAIVICHVVGGERLRCICDFTRMLPSCSRCRIFSLVNSIGTLISRFRQ